MRHPNYDRAFHETPEYIRSAIELGFMKGKKAMKMRHKITSALSIAAALVVILGAAAFGASRLGAPRPDGMLPGRPLSASTATEEPTLDPYATPMPTLLEEPTPATPEPTPMPTLLEEPTPATPEPTLMPTLLEEPTPATPEPTPMPTQFQEPQIPEETMIPELETVYYTHSGLYFHADETCSGLEGALAGSVQDAYHAGKEPCPICLMDWEFVVAAVPAGAQTEISESQIVHMFPDNMQYFHMNETCGGNENAALLSVTAAVELGMTPCPDCLSEEAYALLAVPGGGAVEIGTEILYATKQGNYVHADSECSGMVGAEPYTVRELIVSDGRRLCPVCMPYWSYAVVTREDADATPAPSMYAVMLGDGSERVVEVMAEESAYTDVTISSATYYYTANGIYYHILENCSNMHNADAHTPSEATDSGKLPCPVCIDSEEEIVDEAASEN